MLRPWKGPGFTEQTLDITASVVLQLNTNTRYLSKTIRQQSPRPFVKITVTRKRKPHRQRGNGFMLGDVDIEAANRPETIKYVSEIAKQGAFAKPKNSFDSSIPRLNSHFASLTSRFCTVARKTRSTSTMLSLFAVRIQKIASTCAPCFKANTSRCRTLMLFPSISEIFI